MRAWAAIWCTKVEIVLADGQVVRASDNDRERRDLFWAVRGGGGGNLGFATKWWLNPVRVQKVVAFSGTWRLGASAPSVFLGLLRAIEEAPDRLGAEMTVSTSSTIFGSPWRYEIALSCQLHGSRDEFDWLLGPALAAADVAEAKDCSFKDCSSKDCRELAYWDAQEFFEQRVYPNRYQETSLFAHEVSDDFIDEIFRIWPTWPNTITAARLTAYRVGGKVNVLAPDATAFVHRTYRWMITTDIDWSGGAPRQYIDDNLKWQRSVFGTFSVTVMLGRPGSYQNFPDPGLDSHARAYWGLISGVWCRSRVATTPISCSRRRETRGFSLRTYCPLPTRVGKDSSANMRVGSRYQSAHFSYRVVFVHLN